MEVSGQLHTPGKASGTHWIGGWVGLRASLNAVTKKKHVCSCQESNHGRPVRNLVTTLAELPRLQTEVV